MDLRETVTARARVDGEFVMVDEFLNHRVEPGVMQQVGLDLAALFEELQPGS